MAGHILPSTDADDPNGLSFALAELISRTLSLIERVTRAPAELGTAEHSMRELAPSERSTPTPPEPDE